MTDKNPNKRSGFRNFMRGTLKLACALLIVALVAGAIGGFSHYHENERNRPLATPKVWDEIAVLSLDDTSASLKTKWQDSKVYFQLRVNGYPEGVRIMDVEIQNLSAFDLGPGFRIVFLDNAGFKVYAINVPLNSMTRCVENNGICTGFSENNSTSVVSAEEYRQISNWKIYWEPKAVVRSSSWPLQD
jgi:hypothetical protein